MAGCRRAARTGFRSGSGTQNISQTSTYLMADSGDDDDAMQRFEERREIATDCNGAGKGHSNGAQSATIARRRGANLLGKAALGTVPADLGVRGSLVRIQSSRPINKS